MRYEVFFRCLLCNGIELVESITIKRLRETEPKDVEAALADYYKESGRRQKSQDTPDFHCCRARTGVALNPGEPYPEIGILVFAGLRKKVA